MREYRVEPISPVSPVRRIEPISALEDAKSIEPIEQLNKDRMAVYAIGKKVVGKTFEECLQYCIKNKISIFSK